jgi:putative transposase
MQDLSLELEHRGYPKAANTIERFLDLFNHRASPKDHWKKIRTTNGLERTNKELKRRTRVVGAFPNDESFMRLAVSILMDINEEWLTGRKYLTMDVM